MKSIVSFIEWYGPYSLEEAQNATSEFDYADGLYVVIGKVKGQATSVLQYVGLASDLHVRLSRPHHVIPEVTVAEREIWLGEVMSPRSPGRKVKVTDRMLDLSEWAHAYFLQLPLNVKKRVCPPDRPVIVYNRWFKTDFETPRKQRPHSEWPDIIDFYGREYPAKLVWFGGRQVVQDVSLFVRTD